MNTLIHLLIFDEDGACSQQIKPALNGATLTRACSLAQGRELLAAGVYDAVLIADPLEGRSGASLLREIDTRGCPAPVILINAEAGADEAGVPAADEDDPGAVLRLSADEACSPLFERAVRAAAAMKRRETALRARTSCLEQELAERRQVETQLLAREEAHRAEQAQMREFLDNMHDNFYALDRQWRFTYANRHYGEVIGREPSTLIGCEFWSLFPHYAGTEVQRSYCQVMMEREPLHYRQKGVYSGKLFDVSVFPTREGIAVFSIDRTQEYLRQVQLEEERARLETVLQALPVGVWIADASGRITGKNDQADRIWAGDAPLLDGIERYTEYTAWDARTGDRLTPEDYPQARALLTGAPVEPVELRIRRFDGSEGQVLVSSRPIKDGDGRLVGAVSVNMDITELRQSEEQLRHYAAELERSNKALQDFAFIASHDLQEPLRKIVMFGNLLREQLDGAAPSAVDSVGRMQNAAARMRAMIDGLLELSRASTLKNPFAPVDLKQLVEGVLPDLEARLQAAGGHVIVENLPTVEADEMQMRQLFLNLLGNAIKFHRPGVPPVIRVSGSVESSGTQPALVTIEIQDNGVGFPAEFADQIFQPFRRLHRRSEYEGTGLGLAICKQIVERHRGSIAAVSAAGEGATFTVRLPIEREK